MRMLLKVSIPHEPFNTLVKKGKAGEILEKIGNEIKPEAVYFTEEGGKRTGLYIIEMPKASDIPKFAEPFFLNFNADCHIHPVMLPEDLKNSEIDKLGKKWDA